MASLCHVKNYCSSYRHSCAITLTAEHPIFHLFHTSLDLHHHSIPETVISIFFILHNPIPLWLPLLSVYVRVHTVNSYDDFMCTPCVIHWTWVWYLMWTGVVSVSVTVRVQNWSYVCEWCVRVVCVTGKFFWYVVAKTYIVTTLCLLLIYHIKALLHRWKGRFFKSRNWHNCLPNREIVHH